MNILHISTFITVYISILTFILGSVFGSFINCVAWRISHHEKWWTGRSHCAVCNHPLGILDLIPVFSWICLRGRCRYCGEKISPRYMLTEIFSGGAFLGLLFYYGDLNLMFFRSLGLFVVLLGLSLVDLESYEIPDGFIIFGIVWWLFFQILDAVGKTAKSSGGFRFSAFFNEFLGSSYMNLLAGFTFALALLVLSLIMDRVLKKESLGGGDIKLLFMANLYLGFGSGLFALILACLIGLLFVAVLKKSKIPFGPSISMATMIGLLAGPYVIRWYLGLFLM
jgi:leader peptidase (prepilin peptidase)/N-methyltransferase